MLSILGRANLYASRHPDLLGLKLRTVDSVVLEESSQLHLVCRPYLLAYGFDDCFAGSFSILRLKKEALTDVAVSCEVTCTWLMARLGERSTARSIMLDIVKAAGLVVCRGISN